LSLLLRLPFRQVGLLCRAILSFSCFIDHPPA
jgi:hypothetical protein